MSRGKRPKWMIEIAIERMNILFNRAEMEFITHPERSHRYVELALKLSTKYNTPVPEEWRRRYCKSCKSILLCLRNGEGGIARVANPFSSLVAIAPSGWLTLRSTFFVVNAVTQ